jgi:hypothetical protein
MFYIASMVEVDQDGFAVWPYDSVVAPVVVEDNTRFANLFMGSARGFVIPVLADDVFHKESYVVSSIHLDGR